MCKCMCVKDAFPAAVVQLFPKEVGKMGSAIFCECIWCSFLLCVFLVEVGGKPSK